VLSDILAVKAVEVAALREQRRNAATRDVIDVGAVLRRAPGAPLRLIAEVKLRSPSAGPLSRALSPADRALAYVDAGASMVSILCDVRFFDGSWDHLAAARERLDRAQLRVPLLAKEFVVDERQIEQARDRGADAVLLIARIVSRGRLVELAQAAFREGIEPLIEVVDEAELESAALAGARVVGVNARDLDTLQMDAGRAARLLAAVPAGVVAVHFSGLKAPDDVARVARPRGAERTPDAALIGEALMRADDPRERLAAMARAAANFTSEGALP
jgi:indole-3-glycerol phosphate synthase